MGRTRKIVLSLFIVCVAILIIATEPEILVMINDAFWNFLITQLAAISAWSWKHDVLLRLVWIYDVLLRLVWIGMGIALYFLPTLVAFRMRKFNTVSIGMLNLFLGWTLIGWVAALVWACSIDRWQVMRAAAAAKERATNQQSTSR